MKRKFILYAVIVSLAIISMNSIKAQSVAINTDGTTAHGSAILDIKSINKGLLIPRMTTAQRTAIATPATGLIVFDITTSSLWFYGGQAWIALSAGSSTNYWSLNGNDIYNNTSGNVGIGTTTPTNKLQIGNFSSANITGNDIAIGNGTQAMSFFQSATNSGWYTTNNFALLPGIGGVGNVGIGTASPLAKLHIAGNVKIDGSNTLEFGAGIAGKESSAGKIGYQVFTPDALDIVGAGTQAGVVRKIKFWNEGGAEFSGNVGVGTAATAFKMDIADRIRIRSGSASSTAGIWLNNLSNSSTPAFIGMIADDAVGFYGTTSGWGLRMNTTLGDVAVGNTNTMGGYKLTVAGNQYLGGNLYATGNAEIAGNTLMNGSLIVSGSFQKFFGHYYRYQSTGLAGEANNGYEYNSIVANNAIAGSQFIAFSDARIKKITGKSNTAKDLETINALQITDYTMKDKATYGNKLFKKVIAQEIEKVYPQVISKRTDFIPNVYQVTDKMEKTQKGYLLHFAGKHNIGSNARKLRIQIEDGKAMKEFGIVSIPSDIEVEINAPELVSDKVFVYGEQVNDFRSVDYEGLTTLNISATQELSKQLKEQQTIIEDIKKEMEELKKLIKAGK